MSILNRDRDCDEHNEMDRKIVEGLVSMFDESNVLVRSFRIARDLLGQSHCQPLRLRLLHDRSKATPQYNVIAGLIVGDFTEERKTLTLSFMIEGVDLEEPLTFILTIWFVISNHVSSW